MTPFQDVLPLHVKGHRGRGFASAGEFCQTRLADLSNAFR
jgi:hypothetical protein